MRFLRKKNLINIPAKLYVLYYSLIGILYLSKLNILYFKIHTLIFFFLVAVKNCQITYNKKFAMNMLTRQ